MLPCLCVVACCSPCPCERYFTVIFGSDDGPLRPRYTHTWATYVKVTPTAAGFVLEPHTISWLPDDGKIRLRQFKRVPGRNYTLDESFAYAARTGQAVKVLGPFETDAHRFAHFVAQEHRLNTCGMDYRAIDSIRGRGVANCITAIRDADPDLRGSTYPPLQVGHRGSKATADDLLRAGAIRKVADADWLLPALGR
jgi:hypothetical protein